MKDDNGRYVNLRVADQIKLQSKAGPYLIGCEPVSNYPRRVGVDIRRWSESQGLLGDGKPFSRTRQGLFVPAAAVQWLIHSLMETRDELIADGFLQVTERPEVVKLDHSVYETRRRAW